MFSAEMNSRILGIAVAGLLLTGLGAGAAAAATAVVVKSSASTYPVGSKVDEADTITLESGVSVTVLTSAGTHTMKGPGTFKVGEKPKSNRARFANLTRQRAANRSVTGAVRAAPGEGAERPLSPNLYYVDVSRSGTMCLVDLQAVRLWRPYNAGIATYRVIDPATGGSVDVTFDDGESVAPIDPARMAVNEGNSYTLEGPEGSEPVEVTFVALEQEYDRADQLADALVNAGCMVQLELMGEKLGG